MSRLQNSRRDFLRVGSLGILGIHLKDYLRAATVNGSTGSITMGSNRNFIISGYVNTLKGRVKTTVREIVHFKSKRNFSINAETDIQNGHGESQLSNRRRPPARAF